MACIYGCGLPGLFEGKGFYGKGKFRCSENWTHCPAKRLEIGKRVKNACDKRSDVQKKEIQQKRKDTLSKIDEYGNSGFKKNALAVANARRLPDGSYKGIIKTVKTKREIKDIKGHDIFMQAAIKTAASRFGIYAGLAGKTEFEIYRYHVNKITNKQPLHLLPNNEKRAGYGKSEDPYQLDHKFSTIQGFLNNIPPFIIGHISNLEMLPAKTNNSKGSNCSISKEELFMQFESWRTPE